MFVRKLSKTRQSFNRQVRDTYNNVTTVNKGDGGVKLIFKRLVA
jgi:hypothetical protein